MKKIFYTFILLALIAPTALAQTSTLTSKKGLEILPQAGDHSLGMNAVPVLNFALNAINVMTDNGQGAEHPGFVSGAENAITGKYYTSATEAYRGMVSFSSGSSKNYSHFDDPNSTSENPEELTDVETVSNSTVLISLGKEKRRGHNRLQGFFGADAFIGIGGGKTKNNYAVDGADALPSQGQSRELLYKQGTQFAFGARGFVGVDYFIAPKISIGSEFGWGLGLAAGGRSKTVIETNTNDVIVEETLTGDDNTFFIGTGVDNGGTFLFGGTAALTINFLF